MFYISRIVPYDLSQCWFARTIVHYEHDWPWSAYRHTIISHAHILGIHRRRAAEDDRYKMNTEAFFFIYFRDMLPKRRKSTLMTFFYA